MTHDEIRDMLGAYALYAASPEERAEVEAHLADCAECREEVDLLLGVHEQLGLLAIERDPPPELRIRLLAQVEQDRAAWEREQATQAGTATIPPPTAQPNRQASVQSERAPNWWERLAGRVGRVPRLAYGVGGILAAAVVVLVVLATRSNVSVHTYACALAKPNVDGISFQGAGCTLQVRSDHRTVVAFTHLPALPASKAYELWVIPAKGNPVPVGGFESGGNHGFKGQYNVDAGRYPIAAVTIEQAPGDSPLPHGPIVMTVALKG